jgi:hypothetical protein
MPFVDNVVACNPVLQSHQYFMDKVSIAAARWLVPKMVLNGINSPHQI